MDIKSNQLWNNDSIQFPRLLSEILAVGLPAETLDQLSDSMGLETSEITEVLTRADQWFDQIKEEYLELEKLTPDVFLKRLYATHLFNHDLASYALADAAKTLSGNWRDAIRDNENYNLGELVKDIDELIDLLLLWKNFLVTGKSDD